MTNKLKYHKDYTEFGEPYQLVLPLSLEGLVPDDDSVRLLSHELEGLDYTLLYQAFWKNAAGQRGLSLSMDAEKGRAGTRDIWNCSAGFWNVRLPMTGIWQVFRVGTITARQTRMPPLCT